MFFLFFHAEIRKKSCGNLTELTAFQHKQDKQSHQHNEDQ